MAQASLKPQDILVLAKLITLQNTTAPIKQMSLAQDLGLSGSEIGKSLKRLISSNLTNSTNKPVHKNVTDFLLHGFKFIFPPQVGGLTRGVATAHAAPPLSRQLKFAAEDIYVWPDANGDTRGQSLTPLYRSVTKACSIDPQLYEFISLLDALRVGRARETQLAKDELEKRIKG